MKRKGYSRIKKHKRTITTHQLPVTRQSKFIVSQKKAGKMYAHFYTPRRGTISYSELEDMAFENFENGEYAIFPVCGAQTESGKKVFGKIFRYLKVYYYSSSKWVEVTDPAGNKVGERRL